MNPPDLDALNERHRSSEPAEILEQALRLFHPEITFACSLGLEDVVLVDLLSRQSLKPTIFILDTGRLPQETYDTLAAVRARYGMTFEVTFPRAEAVEALMTAKGPNSFYESLENRLECCRIRKVEPLGRALAGKQAWITGLRREQALSRSALQPFEQDSVNGLVKVSPLATWSLEQVRAYIQAHDVPHNPLQDAGYPSLGCAPCTRAVAPGEDLRAGRWWWEQPEQKECGLHGRQSPPGEPPCEVKP